jgi:hypothetical protein
MEDMESDNATRDRPIPSELIKEASITKDEEDAELVYDHTRFWRDKVSCQYFHYYHGRMLPQHKSSSLAGGRVEAESVVTAGGSPS